MEKDRRLSFYNAEIILKTGEKIEADAVLLPNRNVQVYRVRRTKNDYFEFIEPDNVKSCVITNKQE